MKLEAIKIEKSYGSRKVVNGVDLELKQGEIVGLLGPNGALSINIYEQFITGANDVIIMEKQSMKRQLTLKAQ